MAFNLSSMKAALQAPRDSEGLAGVVEGQNKLSLVFFDTETTGLKPTSEIIQIAARCGDRDYNDYIIPNDEIPKFITELTGFSLVNNNMYNRKGELLKAVSKEVAAGNFMSYLKSIGGKIILIAHNCFRFDAPMLLTLLHERGMIEEFREIVSGFSDTLPLLRHSLPGRRNRGKDYKLVSLATEFLGGSCGAHDAMNDVIMMQELVNHPAINIEASAFVGSEKTVVEMCDNIKLHLRRVEIQREYQKLKTEGTIDISDELIGRLASSGITIEDLRSTLRSGGCDAVHKLLTEKLNKSTGLN